MEFINEMLTFALEQGASTNTIIPDGKLRRYNSAEKPKSHEIWAVASQTHITVGNWRTGIQRTWHPKGHVATSQDKEVLRLARLSYKAESAKKQLEAAKECNLIWSQTLPSHEHPYLTRKNIQTCIARVDRFNNLVVPLRSIAGELMSLQFITPKGDKRFKSGGSLKGNAAMIGSLKNATNLLVCEGYATGCSLHEATELPVVVAFNAGNLLDVCTSLKRQHPMLNLILCADNDHRAVQNGQKNVGLDKANDVAKLLNLRVIWPNFDSDSLGSDFNDVHCQLGLDGLRIMLSPSLDCEIS
jgi:putative DNA primase/helicase